MRRPQREEKKETIPNKNNLMKLPSIYQKASSTPSYYKKPIPSTQFGYPREPSYMPGVFTGKTRYSGYMASTSNNAVKKTTAIQPAPPTAQRDVGFTRKQRWLPNIHQERTANPACTMEAVSISNNAIQPGCYPHRPQTGTLLPLRSASRATVIHNDLSEAERFHLEQERTKVRAKAKEVRALEAKLAQQNKTINQLMDEQHIRNQRLAEMSAKEMKRRVKLKMYQDEAIRLRTRNETNMDELDNYVMENDDLKNGILKLHSEIAVIKERASFASDATLREEVDRLNADNVKETTMNAYIEQDIEATRERIQEALPEQSGTIMEEEDYDEDWSFY